VTWGQGPGAGARVVWLTSKHSVCLALAGAAEWGLEWGPGAGESQIIPACNES